MDDHKYGRGYDGGEYSIEFEKYGYHPNSNQDFLRAPSFANSNFMSSEQSVVEKSPPKDTQRELKDGNHNDSDSFHLEENQNLISSQTGSKKEPASQPIFISDETESQELFTEISMNFEIPDLKEDSIAEAVLLRDMTKKVSTEEASLIKPNFKEEEMQQKINEIYNGYISHVQILQGKNNELEQKLKKVIDNNKLLMTTLERSKDEITVHVKNTRVLTNELNSVKKERELLQNKIKELEAVKPKPTEDIGAIKVALSTALGENHALHAKVDVMQYKIDFLVNYIGEMGSSYNLLANQFRSLSLNFQNIKDPNITQIFKDSEKLLQAKIIQPNDINNLFDKMATDASAGKHTPKKELPRSMQSTNISPTRNKNSALSSAQANENEINLNSEVVKRIKKVDNRSTTPVKNVPNSSNKKPPNQRGIANQNFPPSEEKARSMVNQLEKMQAETIALGQKKDDMDPIQMNIRKQLMKFSPKPK